jgi:hypothetical protein
MGMGGQRHAPATLPPGKRTVPILWEAEWAPGSVWTGVENLAPTWIRSPDCPALSESLYRLSYPGPMTPDNNTTNLYNIKTSWWRDEQIK